MKRFLLVVLAFIGVISVCTFVAAFLLLAFGLGSLGKVTMPAAAVLEIDFERRVVESAPLDPVARFLQDDQLELRALIDAIDRAADDAQVVALRGELSGAGLGLAQIQEVRAAVERFRKSGKPAIAFAETFGEFGPGNAAYYLATAFDRIYLQPSGDCNLTGFYLEHPFVHGTLEKLEIVPRIGQRHEYKNAANFYNEDSFTEAHREASERLLDSLSSQLIAGVAGARGLDPGAVQDLIDRAPLHAHEALEAGLVDGLLYRDQLEDQLREELGEEITGVSIDDYIDAHHRPSFAKAKPTIALIYGYGGVARGSSSSALGGEPVMGATTVGQAISDALEDENVAALVFRVSSPGGSYVASDAIWRETMRARDFEKPLVVSMGDYAASGGYFVSMAADHIVADPATLTGSVGVYGGKLVLGGLMNKLGVTFDQLSTGAHAGIFSANADYTESEWTELNAWLDRVYADFTEKVAAERNLPLSRVQEIARGRVWTGQDALELGLVDELGDLPIAIERAAGLADLTTGEYAVRVFPAPKSTWELLREKRAFRTGIAAWGEWVALLTQVRPLLDLVQPPAPLEAPRVAPRESGRR